MSKITLRYVLSGVCVYHYEGRTPAGDEINAALPKAMFGDQAPPAEIQIEVPAALKS